MYFWIGIGLTHLKNTKRAEAEIEIAPSKYIKAIHTNQVDSQIAKLSILIGILDSD